MDTADRREGSLYGTEYAATLVSVMDTRQKLRAGSDFSSTLFNRIIHNYLKAKKMPGPHLEIRANRLGEGNQFAILFLVTDP